MRSKITRIGPTSANRVYLVRASPSPKFLASLGTSDILGTLYAKTLEIKVKDT